MNLFSGIQSEIVRKAARKCAEFVIYVRCGAKCCAQRTNSAHARARISTIYNVLRYINV